MNYNFFERKNPNLTYVENYRDPKNYINMKLNNVLDTDKLFSKYCENNNHHFETKIKSKNNLNYSNNRNNNNIIKNQFKYKQCLNCSVIEFI